MQAASALGVEAAEADAYQLSESDARDLIRTSDRRRSLFVQSLVGRPWTDACLYDVVVNTSTVGLETATEAVAAIVAARLQARR